MDFEAIKAEVTSQPQYAEAYAAKDVNAIQALYNSVTVIGAVNMETLDAYLKSNYVSPSDTVPAFWSIKAAAAGTEQPQAALAQMVLDLFTSRLGALDFSIPSAAQALDNCVAAGVLSAQNKTELLAMATKPRNASIEDLAFALYDSDGTPK
jgi:hypothetical protein